MCSVDPRDPPPHLTLPGSFLSCATTSAMLLKGELDGSTKTLYSLVMRAIGVACDRFTGGLPVMMPPRITAPITISEFGSPLLELTNCASPNAPAAPPLLSYVTLEATPASCRALPNARPVVSQPPPGLAGIIIFRAAAARALSGSEPAAASAARLLRKVPRRMLLVSRWMGCVGDHARRACQSAVRHIGETTESGGLGRIRYARASDE